ALVAFRRADGDAAAAHRFADVVIRLSREVERDAGAEERAEALAGGAGEASADATRRLRGAELPCEQATDARADGAVVRRDPERRLDDRGTLQGGPPGLGEERGELAALDGR